MSLIAKMFGGGKGKNKAPSPQEAIQKLRETEEMLEKKQAFLEKKIDQEIATAKKNAAKNKRGNDSCSMIVYRGSYSLQDPHLSSFENYYFLSKFSEIKGFTTNLDNIYRSLTPHT